MKTKIEKLKNGLTVVYCQDKTRHSCSLELIVKFGGNNRQFIIDNKEYNLTPGYAHFLEHAIIEHNSYQNLLTLFSKKNIDFNGITNFNFTSFYFNCLRIEMMLSLRDSTSGVSLKNKISRSMAS